MASGHEYRQVTQRVSILNLSTSNPYNLIISIDHELRQM